MLGRDLPDGTRKWLQVYLGGAFFGQNLLILIGRDARLQKHCKKQYGRHLFVNAPVQNRQGKSEKNPCFFNFLTSIFWFATSFFAVPQVAGPGGGFLSFWTRFRTDFRRFVIAETLVFTVFFCFLHAWRLASKLPKNLVNYAVLCYGVNENIVNTSVFWRWLKKHCKLQCFWPPDPQKPWYLQWFLLLTAQKHCK